MEQFNIYLNSSVANIAANTPCYKLTELKELAKKETVWIEFQYGYCRITAKNSRKVKVPKKATNSSDGFIKWVEEKIKSAWK